MSDMTTDQDIADAMGALKAANEAVLIANHSVQYADTQKREALNTVVSKFMHLFRNLDPESKRAVLAAVKNEMSK